ncbi:MAG: hypothetical protein CFH10_01233 [Alphaproteobacteria bacterium MarineAlpha4_Bin2]|nr:MAG: hypothetical protein CFH10_01233 [Alphaproteobacteria bacterium MarineAlpha4_Bin2]
MTWPNREVVDVKIVVAISTYSSARPLLAVGVAPGTLLDDE